MSTHQLALFPHTDKNPALLLKRSSAFVDNMSLPIHRWFRYSAGFSAEWVEQEIQNALKDGPVRVLDPFAGVGQHCYQQSAVIRL